jgi:hypothetical protein
MKTKVKMPLYFFEIIACSWGYWSDGCSFRHRYM